MTETCHLKENFLTPPRKTDAQWPRSAPTRGPLGPRRTKSIARQRSEIAFEPSIGPCLRPQIMEILTFASCDKSSHQKIFIIGDNNKHATDIESCLYISSVFPES